MLQAANSPEKRPFLARFGIRRSFAKKARWLEVSLLYLADFLAGLFSQTDSLCLEDFLCYSKIFTYVRYNMELFLWS